MGHNSSSILLYAFLAAVSPAIANEPSGDQLDEIIVTSIQTP